jgi:hypothetical protein
LVDPVFEAAEISFVGRRRRRRCRAIEQQLAQALTSLIGANQLADVLAARAVAAPRDAVEQIAASAVSSSAMARALVMI